MSGHRDLAKRLLPDRFVNWYRARRVRILQSAGGGTKITPGMVARHGWGKTAGVRSVVRRGVIKVTPKPVVTRTRRKRAVKRYMKALSYELLERETQLDYIEGRVAARRDGFYERMVREVLERTEMILQELDRRIEGVSARGGERMNAIEDQLIQLRGEIGRLRQLSDPRLGDVGERARAEVPEVPTAEAEDSEPDTPADAAAAHVAEAAADPIANGSHPEAAGNGHVPAQAPAATSATAATSAE
jgi:TolA-binding protein